MAKPPPPPPAKTLPATNGKGEAPPPIAVVHNLKQPQSGDLKPLNFKVDPEFHRAFKAELGSRVTLPSPGPLSRTRRASFPTSGSSLDPKFGS